MILIGSEVIHPQVNSDAEVIYYDLCKMRLGQSPNLFPLPGKEGRENLHLLIDSEPYSNTDEFVMAVFLESEEDRVGDVHVVNLFDLVVVAVDFWDFGDDVPS